MGTVGVQACEAVLRPALLCANTRNVYDLPTFSPVTVIHVAVYCPSAIVV